MSSTTAVPLINGWTESSIYENQAGYEPRELMYPQTAHTAAFFKFHNRPGTGRTYPTYDGWWGHETLPKLNAMRQSPTVCTNILWRVGKKMGFPAVSMSMAGGWMWQQTLGHS
ncbi:hypothetical protein [Blautia stercoris]